MSTYGTPHTYAIGMGESDFNCLPDEAQGDCPDCSYRWDMRKDGVDCPNCAAIAREIGLRLDRREIGTILAALRYWQHNLAAPWGRTFTEIHDEIASDGGETASLSGDEIDALCDKINIRED